MNGEAKNNSETCGLLFNSLMHVNVLKNDGRKKKTAARYWISTKDMLSSRGFLKKSLALFNFIHG